MNMKLEAPAIEEILKTKVNFCLNTKCLSRRPKTGECNLKNIAIDKNGKCYQYKLDQQTKEEK